MAVGKILFHLCAIKIIVLVYMLIAVFSQSSEADPESCIVPPAVDILPEYAFYSRIDVLTLQGRCFLSCLRHTENLTRRYDEPYSLWPFEVVTSSCKKHKTVHECTRGCYTWSLFDSGRQLQDCTSDCEARCLEECGGLNRCDNPDPFDLWLTKRSCAITCSSANCETGCNVGEELQRESMVPGSVMGGNTGSGAGIDANSVPPSPIAAPVLTFTSPGEYSISLENAMPTIGGGLGSTHLLPVAFLFKVEDHVTDNVSYIWQNDPTSTLYLLRYSCHNVTVSFAVINRIGLSSYSPPSLTFMVEGDDTMIPNPPRSVTHTLHEDTRIGYFEHFFMNLTWQSPEDSRYLDRFVITFEASNKRLDHANGTIMRTITPSENGINSVIFHSGNDSVISLYMDRTYFFSITSVGVDGSNTYESDSIVVQPFFASRITDFNCSRYWDGRSLFSFILNWTAPLQWAQGNVAEGFHLEPSSSEYPGGYSLIAITIMNNVTRYSYKLSGDEVFFRPISADQEEKRFIFELFMDWNLSLLLFDPHISIGAVTCSTDGTSPAPSSVRDFDVVSVAIQGSNRITVDFRWEPPVSSNGQLGEYSVCISPRPIQSDDILQGGEIQCMIAQNNVKFAIFTWNIYTEQCLYCQMRARNTFVFGNWTDPVQLESTSRYCTTEEVTAVSSTQLQEDVSSTQLQMTVEDVSSTPSSQMTVIIAVCACILGVILVIIVVTALVILYIRRRRKVFWRRTEAHPVDPMFAINRETRKRADPSTPTIEPLLMSDEWEVSPSEIIVQDSLGEGAFGEVYKGILKGPITCSKVQPSLRRAVFIEVAIKLLKKSARGSERQDFFSEIETMKKVSEGYNPHVVGMLGCVTLQEPLCLVIEFVRYGDLLSYLRTNRKVYTGSIPDQGGGSNIMDPYLKLGQLSSNDLVSFAYQIASAMEYLSSVDIVHRDLACRNILVDEGKVLKITDFGMSRETDEIYVQKSKGRVPFKWMALESIVAREFTSASDVWSYGITLWEIATIGGVPYPSIHNEDLLSLLNRGYRMEKPDNCAPEIYSIMLSCWNKHPRQRPTFTDLRDKFDNLLLADHKGDYIEFSFDTVQASNHDGSGRDGFLNISPVSKRYSHTSSGQEECAMLLSSEKLPIDTPSPLTLDNVGNGSPRFSPRQQSPQQLSLRQCSPSNRLFPSSQSICNNQEASAKSSPRRQLSPLKLLPRRGSRESLSPQPFHATNPIAVEEHTEEQEQQQRHRPMSMLLSRERDRVRRRGDISDRYVKEPTKLAGLGNKSDNGDACELTVLSQNVSASPSPVVRRRGSEGTLNMNSDGYVSFIGVDSRDLRANLPSQDIRITVTGDL